MKFLTLIPLVLLPFKVCALSWQPENILAENCHLKHIWPYPDMNIPKEIKVKALTPELIESERAKWNQAAIESHKAFQYYMKSSNYYYANGRIFRSLSLQTKNSRESATFDLLQRYTTLIYKSIPLKNGSKVIVCDNNEFFEIYYELWLPPTTRGPSYHVLLMIEKSTGQLLEQLVHG